MKKIIRGTCLLLSLICCLALISCNKAAAGNNSKNESAYQRSFDTDAGVLSFHVPLGDREVKAWEEDLKGFAEAFENAYLKLTSADTGLLGEINTPEINAVLDCDEKEVKFYSDMYELYKTYGADPVSGGSLTFDKNAVRMSSGEVKIDFSALATPYAMGEMIKAVKEKGYSDGLISIGNLCTVLGLKNGEEAYHIGIPDSEKEKDGEASVKYYGYISITDGYVAMSEGDGELAKTVVYCTEPMDAQVIAGKLSAMTLEEAEAYYLAGEKKFEAVFIKDGKPVLTEGLSNTTIFTEETTAETEK